MIMKVLDRYLVVMRQFWKFEFRFRVIFNQNCGFSFKKKLFLPRLPLPEKCHSPCAHSGGPISWRRKGKSMTRSYIIKNDSYNIHKTICMSSRNDPYVISYQDEQLLFVKELKYSVPVYLLFFNFKQQFKSF